MPIPNVEDYFSEVRFLDAANGKCYSFTFHKNKLVRCAEITVAGTIEMYNTYPVEHGVHVYNRILDSKEYKILT